MPENRTRVLVVIAHLGQGGSERFAYEILKAFDRERFEIELLTKIRPRKRDYYDEKIQALGIPIHRRLPILLHYARRLMPWAFRIAPLRWIAESLHRAVARVTMGDLLDRFDVIDVIQLEYYYLIQPLLPNNDRVLVHVMAAAFQYPNEKLYDYCRPGRKYRFAVFNPTFRRDIADTPCRDAEIFDFPLAIDLSGVPDLSSCARIAPPYRVGMFVRISQERDVSGILRAFRRLVDSVDARLIWYGHGNPALYARLLDDLGIRHLVSFPGQAPDLERTLREDGLSFIYATGDGSTIGYSGVEVASYGFPMLIWNQGEEAHDQVLAETGGAIHAHHDPNVLAGETLAFLADVEAFRALGRRLRRWAMEKFEIRFHIRNLEAKLEEIAVEGRRTAEDARSVDGERRAW